MILKSPYPYFGGKSRVAHVIWDRFGNTPGYVEPFFGSGAALLARPHAPSYETINDLDCWVANFWRAIKNDPEGVAAEADYPVIEADFHARNLLITSERAKFSERIMADPNLYDSRLAGWWVWGQSMSIGTAWGTQNQNTGHVQKSKPKNNPNGIHSLGYRSVIKENFRALADRLRNTRVLCGDWGRCLTPVETAGIGLTAVLLDPPYADNEYVYSEKSTDVSHLVREWAIANGENPLMRIALCGYREHDMPASWTAFDWKATGGYGNQGDGEGRKNAELERIWFSKYCLNPRQDSLFGDAFVCPYCGESGGESRIVTSGEYQGESPAGGRVEWDEERCSLCCPARKDL